MLKSILVSLVAFVGLQAQAAELNQFAIESFAKDVAVQTLADAKQLINWTVGDTTDHKLSGGIINGTMHTQVREETPEGYWMQQDMDLGFVGQQKVEVLIDKNNGQVLQMIVNGQKQTPPSADDVEIVDSHRDTVTVPKGTFDCMYVKIHDKKQNQDQEMWVNPEQVAITGMIKTIAQSQMGPITVELTNFRKQ